MKRSWDAGTTVGAYPSTEENLLLCLSHLRWNSVYQRPHHLMSRAAKGMRVCFFEEPLFDGSHEPALMLRREDCGVIVATPLVSQDLKGAALAAAQRQLIDRYLADVPRSRLITWYYTPMALTFTHHLAPHSCVYDNMDELSAFAGAPAELLRLEKALFARSLVVFTGGQSLYEAKRERHTNVHAFPSSVDVHHFARARVDRAEPADQQSVPRPRLGFFGVVDERMDMALVAEVAALRPDWQLVMIGPTAKIAPESRPQRPNIHWLGPKTYDQLPNYLAAWDVGIMPFAINEATRFISPTKTPEFLAAGLPVVSTPIRDVVRPYGESGLVEIAADARSVVARVEALLARPRQPWLGDVDRFLATISWDKTWAGMRRLFERRELHPRRLPITARAEEPIHV